MWTAEDRERNMHLAMDTALHCFRELGVEHSTQKIISQRSGLSSKSLQRYFGSKEELVLKSMGLYADQYCERLNGYLRTQPPAKNGLEQILQFLEGHKIFFESCDFSLGLLMEMQLYLHHHGVGKPTLMRTMGQADRFSDYLRCALVRGIQDGSMKQDLNAELQRVLIAGSFLGLLQNMMLAPSVFERAEAGISPSCVLQAFVFRLERELAADPCCSAGNEKINRNTGEPSQRQANFEIPRSLPKNEVH